MNRIDVGENNKYSRSRVEGSGEGGQAAIFIAKQLQFKRKCGKCCCNSNRESDSDSDRAGRTMVETGDRSYCMHTAALHYLLLRGTRGIWLQSSVCS